METKTVYIGHRQYFNRAQKLEILKEHQNQGVPITQLARKHGIHVVTIYQWKRNMNTNDDSLTPEKIRELILENNRLKDEAKRLKNKVADLSIQNEILEEAIAISKKRNF